MPYHSSVKSLVLAVPFIVWLALAVPLNCHHGLTTPWAATGHVHQAGSMDETLQAGADATASEPALCQHQDTSAATPMAHAVLDSSLDSASSHVALEASGRRLLSTGLLAYQEVSLPPLERPPSYSA